MIFVLIINLIVQPITNQVYEEIFSSSLKKMMEEVKIDIDSHDYCDQHPKFLDIKTRQWHFSKWNLEHLKEVI